MSGKDLQNPLFDIEPFVVDYGKIGQSGDFDDFKIKKKILERSYEPVDPIDFYRFIFPEGSFERLGHQEDRKGNGIAVSIDAETKRGAKTIVTDGLEQLPKLLDEAFVIMSPISYFGRSRKAENALWMHALTLDIDYVDEGSLKNLIRWFEELDLLARPTFIVNSGHGLHLYYVFEDPVAMHRESQHELRKLKNGLIDQTWTKYTSYRPERKEALGIVQGFRMVGSSTKLPGYRLSAYRTGGKVSIEYLNGYVSAGNRAEMDQPPLFTLENAREQWPDWYERRIVRGEAPGRWHVKRDLYDWWVRRIEGEAKVGARYFCIMYLAVYAAKCDIDEDELRRDAARLQIKFNELGNDSNEPFTWDECEKALQCYNESYVRYPRETIETNTKISMPANKRNGRKQDQHMAVMRAIQSVVNPDWRKNNGRPKGSTKSITAKGEEIRAYKAEHPEANHSEIARALGVSRPTVIKWLKMGKGNKL